MFLEVKIQIDLVENDADQIVLCCLHTYMGGKSQKISSLFVKLENWCLFFHDTAFWVNRISIFFLQCIISSLHYVTKFTRRDA